MHSRQLRVERTANYTSFSHSERGKSRTDAAARRSLSLNSSAGCKIASMEYTKLGRTGLDVSRICLGCMSYGGGNR
ncbi:MAG: hypothetical protein WCA23_25025, partial [Stellaceae bacterium]